MKLLQSIIFLLVARIGCASFCGCDSCTQEVWDSLATNANGSYTCGERITWLQTAEGYDETSACIKVSGDEFPNGPCGPVCDPSKCNPPTLAPTPSPPVYCGCDSCSQEIWDSLASDLDGSYTCGARISWLQTQGYDEIGACTKISRDEFPDGPCGPACDPTKCNAVTGAPMISSPTMVPVSRPTLKPTREPSTTPSRAPSKKPVITSNPTTSPSKTSTLAPTSSSRQRCGGAVDYTSDPNQACQSFLWGPTGDSTMHCFAYGGSADPCHLNNNNDQNDGLFKDPSLCVGDTFYLWDEPDTQGRDYFWAGREWLAYSERFAQELEAMRSRGTKVTGPLLKAGDSGVLKQNMHIFFDACGAACFDESDPAYIDVIAVNGFCGPWNGAAGCRAGASFIYNEAEQASNAFYNLPVYITNWSRLQTSAPADQIDAIEAIDEFFPSSGGVIDRVYWFGARDYGGGAETTGYLTNSLPDGGTLGELWRMKCAGI